MARSVRNTKLDTRSARSKLSARKAPYWVRLSRGCALGYRKGPRSGVWVAKAVWGSHRQEQTLGPADDILDADDASALNYDQAQRKARRWFRGQVRIAEGIETPFGPYTIAVAIQDYLATYKAGHTRGGGRAASNTEAVVNAAILPGLGDVEVAKLTTQRLRQWHSDLAARPARVRSGRGMPAKERRASNDPDEARRRKATANRILTVLKAALNHAWREGKVASDDPWRRVQPFADVEMARVHYLSDAECRRLVNATNGDFRPLVQAALLTGCRYGELTALRPADFDSDAGTLTIRTSKSGKSRHVVLTDEGRKFFDTATAGRDNQFPIFLRPDGKPWGRSHQARPLALACKAAKIKPAASFHILRHTYASRLAMNGVPLPVIARNLGHADTRMTEKHYAHLAPSHIADSIRAGFGTMGIVEPSGVKRIGPRSKA